MLAFGLYLLGVFNLGAFARERRFHLTDKPLGYLGTLVVGIAFGAGWTPCIGPILGSILTYAATQAEVSRGVMLLGAYSLGLAIPFLLAAVAIERFLAAFAVIKRHMVLDHARVRRGPGRRRVSDDDGLHARDHRRPAGVDAGRAAEPTVAPRSRRGIRVA